VAERLAPGPVDAGAGTPDPAGKGDGRTARSRRGVSLVDGVPPTAAQPLARV